MKKVTAVAINFNKRDITLHWLASMLKQKTQGFRLDIVIVDNASKEKFEVPKKPENVTVIYSETNSGFTGGNIIGMKYALAHDADYILVINNDTVADPDLVANMLQILDSNEHIGMVAPKIYFEKGHEYHKDRYQKNELGKVFWYAGGYTDWANVRSVHRGVDEVDHGQYDKVERIKFASGCCMLIKREVLEKVGLFDDTFFMYFEDADLNERITKAGYDIDYVPKAVLWHINAASTGGSGNQLQDYFLTRNQMVFGMRYAPLRTKIALIRQSLRYLVSGRPMQKRGIRDYYLRRFNKGTYFNKQ